jgi:glycosyltransferase involved in cell wall biosynthesis
MEKAYQSLENPNNITFTGRLSNNELSLVLGAAKFLAYPSLFEGFGVPIIEAMSANVPVLTSHTSCMPEISGEAAYLIDPFSEAEIKDAIADLDTNEKLRNELITKGKENAAQFSWDLTTQKLENSILNCIAKNGST